MFDLDAAPAFVALCVLAIVSNMLLRANENRRNREMIDHETTDQDRVRTLGL